MTHQFVRRFFGTLATLLVVSFITFVALAVSPGDTASALAGDHASAEQLQTMRAQLGLDQPLLVRYATFLQNALHGDLGRSLVNNRAVSELVSERLPNTLALAISATTLAAIIGMWLGMTAALHASSWLDTLLMSLAALGLAIPTFWSGLMLMLIVAVQWHWLPVIGADDARQMILPAITLALPTGAALARMVRSSLLEVLRSDYVRTAHAKGLRPRHVLAHHIVRTSLVPVITMLGLHLGYLLSGAFIVETIFCVPGLGRLAVQAIFDRDYPVVLGTTLTIALMYLLINFLVDLAHGWLDPQVAHGAI